MALRMATGWEPDDADVVIGTSGGAFTAAMVRGGQLELETLVGDTHHRHEVAERLRGYLFRRSLPRGVGRWMRRGVLPALRRPNLNLVLGSPALYHTRGLGEWVKDAIGDAADDWPDKPTVIVSYDIQSKTRMPFGTEAAPDVSLSDAVRASAAVPFVFEPVKLDGRWYADGGLGSGTSADLLLANPTPLDLVIIIAPLASTHVREEARFYEETLDRIGREALDAELALIEETWPNTEILVLRPTPEILTAARPNPLSTEAALPTFLRTLRTLREHLGSAEIWSVLKKHLVAPANRS
jgi:NTE family protein